MEQRCEEPQVTGDRSLPGQQRKHPLMDLQVHAVDPVIVGDHQLGEFEILVGERLQRPVEGADDEFDPFQRVALEPGDLVLVLDPVRNGLLLGGGHQPNLPVT